MKRDFRLHTLGFRLVTVALCYYLIVLAAGAVDSNPYEAIVGRNVFGLKPPPPTTPPTLPPPVAAATTLKLLGISTILDRRQVLVKVKTAARPPEPAKEKSYLWSEGQGEDDIEVLEIDAAAGAVKLKSRGEPLSLTMKDDSEKPAVGAALPGPALPSPQVPTLPGVPPASAAGNAFPANQGGVPTMGGSGRTLPTRSLRTSATDGAGLGVGAATGAAAANMQAQTSLANQRSPEENVALYEINRAKNEALIQSGVKLPRMPPHVSLAPPQQ